jgi:hypothetical protein
MHSILTCFSNKWEMASHTIQPNLYVAGIIQKHLLISSPFFSGSAGPHENAHRHHVINELKMLERFG